MWKALAYYESCLDKDEIEKLKGKPLERLIQQYGSWSITDKTWKEEDWELITNLARIHKYLALPVFFTTTVAIDVKNSSQYIITVCLEGDNVFCRLLLRMTGMDKDWSLKNLGQLFQVSMPAKLARKVLRLVLPGEICLISSSSIYSSILFKGKSTKWWLEHKIDFPIQWTAISSWF